MTEIIQAPSDQRHRFLQLARACTIPAVFFLAVTVLLWGAAALDFKLGVGDPARAVLKSSGYLVVGLLALGGRLHFRARAAAVADAV
jgi:hypothetical protein